MRKVKILTKESVKKMEKERKKWKKAEKLVKKYEEELKEALEKVNKSWHSLGPETKKWNELTGLELSPIGFYRLLRDFENGNIRPKRWFVGKTKSSTTNSTRSA